MSLVAVTRKHHSFTLNKARKTTLAKVDGGIRKLAEAILEGASAIAITPFHPSFPLLPLPRIALEGLLIGLAWDSYLQMVLCDSPGRDNFKVPRNAADLLLKPRGGFKFWGHTHPVYNSLGECDTDCIGCQ